MPDTVCIPFGSDHTPNVAKKFYFQLRVAQSENSTRNVSAINLVVMKNMNDHEPQ